MLVTENLTVVRDKRKIIDSLNLTINEGTITCIIAPNGTGKTTLFNSISNNLKRKSGSIKINQFHSTIRSKFNKEFFFLEDDRSLMADFSAIENLELIKSLWGSQQSITEVIKFMGIEDYKHKKVKKMSLGMKQKLLIAAAIISDARVLIFDEPLNGLDIRNVDLIIQVFSKLKNEKKSIMISSHNIYEISSICDDIYFLNEGKLITVENDFDTIKQKYLDLF